ncbi:hypothetical protein MishRS11D_43360 (plasmid) [Methylomagnum ishizawai]|nr:hypothetical protein MishRS11D_43360 [Methylomagnum ishizawai]
MIDQATGRRQGDHALSVGLEDMDSDCPGIRSFTAAAGRCRIGRYLFTGPPVQPAWKKPHARMRGRRVPPPDGTAK